MVDASSTVAPRNQGSGGAYVVSYCEAYGMCYTVSPASIGDRNATVLKMPTKTRRPDVSLVGEETMPGLPQCPKNEEQKEERGKGSGTAATVHAGISEEKQRSNTATPKRLPSKQRYQVAVEADAQKKGCLEYIKGRILSNLLRPATMPSAWYSNIIRYDQGQPAVSGQNRFKPALRSWEYLHHVISSQHDKKCRERHRTPENCRLAKSERLRGSCREMFRLQTPGRYNGAFWEGKEASLTVERQTIVLVKRQHK